jgi:hypothetical protein
MKTENLNSQLFQLYNKNYSNLQVELNNDDLEEWPALPFLIKLNEDQFNQSDLKIMFFGQETNGWIDQNKIGYTVSLEALMDQYYEFCYNGGKEEHGGHFWNAIKNFMNLLKNKFPTKEIYPIYNNIIKIGKMEEKGRPSLDILHLENKYLNVIKDELNILKPDIIIFFTGPNYDDQIELKLGDVIDNKFSIPDFSTRQLCRVNLNENCIAFRCYHPNFLYRNNIRDYFDSILKEIN